MSPSGRDEPIIRTSLSASENLALWAWRLLSWLLLPVVLLRYRLMGLREPGYGLRLGERIGRVRAALGRHRPPLWIHAVSLGEVRAAIPLVESLLAENRRGNRRQIPLLFTCTTPTGSHAIRQQFDRRVLHCYLPWDAPGILGHFLRLVRPRLLILTEAELWPNLLSCCRQRKIPVLLANARISQRSARRYRRFSRLSAPLFRNLHAALARTPEDAERLIALGVPGSRVQTVGDLKYSTANADDVKKSAQTLGRDLQLGHRKQIWLAGSTHAGEDEQVLEATRLVLQQHPEALLILAPRHPRRFNQVAELLQKNRLSYRRRSKGEAARGGQVYLLDSIGELSACFALVQVAFVGGSLIPVGGHNLLEPAIQQCPVLAGPHLENFAEVADLLRQAGGLRQVCDARGMAAEVSRLLSSPEQAQQMGQQALKGIQSADGSGDFSLRHHVQAVRQLLLA